MKKIFSALLATAMVASMSVAALAASTPITSPSTGKGTGSYGIGVNWILEPGNSNFETVISADISWESMVFEYKGASSATWNPLTHTEEGISSGGWVEKPRKITVTNHSNADIRTKATFEQSTELNVVGWFREANTAEGAESPYLDADELWITHDLKSAETKYIEQADSVDFYFYISDDSDPITSSNVDLGTISVNIESLRTLVSTKEELMAAAQKGGTIILTNDINLGSDSLALEYPTVLTLNGYNLTSRTDSWVIMAGNTDITVKYGTVENANNLGVGINSYGTLTLEMCTVTANYTCVESAGICYVKDSIIASRQYLNAFCLYVNSTAASNLLEISGTTTIEGDIETYEAAFPVRVVEGTYNFDPTAYVDTETYTVSANGSDSWTVTKNS